jgi:hypothetical protein
MFVYNILWSINERLGGKEGLDLPLVNESRLVNNLINYGNTPDKNSTEGHGDNGPQDFVDLD